MKRLLLLACGIVSAICLGLLAAQAGATPTAPSPPLQYSRPAADGLVADKKIQCLQSCDSNFQQCASERTNGAVCVNLRQHCQQICNQNG
jgi:hypothetical protein